MDIKDKIDVYEFIYNREKNRLKPYIERIENGHKLSKDENSQMVFIKSSVSFLENFIDTLKRIKED